MLQIRENNLLRECLNVFDGEESEIWEYTISIEAENEVWQCSTQDVVRHDVKKLPELLATESFEKIIEKQGFTSPTNEFGGLRGKDGLNLYFYLIPSTDAAFQMLLIVGIGKFQPWRYMANLEGLWKAHEV